MNLAELAETLLKKLNSGELDGPVGDIFDAGKVMVVKVIENGKPQIVKHGPDTKFFDGKENIRTPGKKTIETFETDSEKLSFLQKFGWLMSDPDAREYSSHFKPKPKSKKKK